MISEAPDDDVLRNIEECAAEWADEAGRQASAQFRHGLHVEYKDKNRLNPVTEADRQVEDYLRSSISGRFRDHRILGEERDDIGPEGADFVWVLDPIDGTVNFVSGIPIFAVSVGVLYRGIPAVGAIFMSQSPHLNSGTMHARMGGGCYLDDERLHVFEEQQSQPGRPASLPAAMWRRFALGKGLRRKPIEVRTMGSIAWEMALVAAGVLQFGAYRSPRLWDVAAGLVLVGEAGGATMTWDEMKRRWIRLERCEAPISARAPRKSGLRDWSKPVLAGGQGPTAFVAEHLRPRSGFDQRISSLLWRLLSR